MQREEAEKLRRLGAFVRQRRQTLGWTQTELSERLGWTQDRVSAVERGRYGLPSLPSFDLLAAALDVSLTDLLSAAGYIPDAGDQYDKAPVVPTKRRLISALQHLIEIETLDLHTALTKAMHIVTEALNADGMDTFLLEEETRSLVAIGRGESHFSQKLRRNGLERIPLVSGGRIVEAYRTGKPLAVANLAQDSTALHHRVNALGVRSAIYVPLVIQGQVRGVLAVGSTRVATFGSEDFGFAQIVARWIGLVAEHANQVEALVRQQEEEAAARTERMVRERIAREVADHMRHIVHNLRRICHTLAESGACEAAEDLEATIRLLTLTHGAIISPPDPILHDDFS